MNSFKGPESPGYREAYGFKHKVAGFIFNAYIFHRNT